MTKKSKQQGYVGFRLPLFWKKKLQEQAWKNRTTVKKIMNEMVREHLATKKAHTTPKNGEEVCDDAKNNHEK